MSIFRFLPFIALIVMSGCIRQKSAQMLPRIRLTEHNADVYECKQRMHVYVKKSVSWRGGFFDKTVFTPLHITIENKSDKVYIFDPKSMNIDVALSKRVAAQIGPGRAKPWTLALGGTAAGVAPSVYLLHMITTAASSSGLPLLLGLPFLPLIPIGCIAGIGIGISNGRKRMRMRNEIERNAFSGSILPGDSVSMSFFAQNFKSNLLVVLQDDDQKKLRFAFELI